MPDETRRGSREAIEKRRVARAFNDLLAGGGRTLDGRTAKRRKRLLEELRGGKKRTSGRELKPVEMLAHLNELLTLGEPAANLRRVCAPRKSLPKTDALGDTVKRLHAAYGFRPETYAFVGVSDEVLRAAGVKPSRPKRKPRAAAED